MNRFFSILARGIAYFVAAAAVLVALAGAAVWFLLPQLEDYKPEVERMVSAYLDQDITIAGLSGEWSGLNVTVRASGVRVAVGDHPGSGMRFGEMYLSFDPLSLLVPGETFERLEVKGPTIEAARLADGRIRVGDTIIGTPRGTLRRLLQGRNLVISDGTLIWRDALSEEQPLQLQDVDIQIRSQGGQRRFEFTTSPPEELVGGFRGNGSYDPESLGAGTWTASISISVEQLNLDGIPAVLQERLPWKSRGRVDTEVHAQWRRGALITASAELAAHDFVIPYARDKTPLSATRFSSSLFWRRSDEAWRLVFNDSELVLGSRPPVSVSRFELERREDERIYSARDVNVRDLLGVANEMDVELPWKDLIDDLHPRGSFSRAALTLTGPYLDVGEWRFEGEFRDVGWRAQGRYPGVQGLDGRLTANESRGELALASGRLELDAPGSLDQAVAFDRVAAAVEWHRWGDDWVVDVGDGELANDDLHLANIDVYTRLHADPSAAPYVLARMRIPRADVKALRGYLPVKRMSGKLVEWLDQALLGGQLSQGRFYLNGPLDSFPYDDGRGELQFSARIRDGVLDFHEDWPNLEGLEGDMGLENGRFEARVRRGSMMSSPIERARVWSDDFFERDRTLHIQGDLAARADDVVQFLRRGPLNRNPPPPYSTMDASGSGTLGLRIELPFTRLKEASRVQGRYAFEDVAVEVGDDIEFTELAGTVGFTESTVEGEGVTGRLFGGPVEADVSTVEPGRPMTFAITGRGTTDVSRLDPVVGPVTASRLVGEASWRGRFVGGPGPNQLDVSSDLQGVEILFPAPLWKAPEAAGGIEIQVGFDRHRRRVSLDLENRLTGELHYATPEGEPVLERGVLNLGGSRELPDSGLSVAVRGDAFDLDQWVSEVERMRRDRERVNATESGRAALFEHLRSLDMDVDNLRYMHRDLGPVEVRAASGDSRAWTARLDGARLEGTGRVRLDPEPARYELELNRLHWPRLENGERATTYETPPQPTGFPHLSISAEDFRYGDMRLGTLDLQAGPEKDAWVIRHLSLQQPALNVEVEGRWTANRFNAHHTDVSLEARADEFGNALSQLGLKEQIANGRAELSADLGWSGQPSDFDFAGLSGRLSFNAEDGRFLKLKPGSGRLLGLFNIETLARRFKLDFRDVFEEGLAFDRINGKAGITAGLLETDGIYIVSPAALIEMEGSTHLAQESYDLDVTVAPEVGANLSLAGAIANPAAGAMIFVVQRLFKKQMAKLIHYRYRVTGDWSDPIVEPVERQIPERERDGGDKP